MKTKNVVMVGLGFGSDDKMQVQLRCDDGSNAAWHELGRQQAEILFSGLDIFLSKFAEKDARRCDGNGVCMGVEHIDAVDVATEE